MTISKPQLGHIASPASNTAARWEDNQIVSLVELHPRPFTPTTITPDGAQHDDTIDTALVERILSKLGFPATADIISAGWRTARTAHPQVRGWYQKQQGHDPAPAYRRTWITIRLDPFDVWPNSMWRGDGVGAVAQAAVAVTVRMAETLSAHGVDAHTAASFDHYDRLTGYRRELRRQYKTHLQHNDTYTTVYSARGGPNVWWSARAEHTTTRVRIKPGEPPHSTVALTTTQPIQQDPDGWVRLRGSQLAAWRGETPMPDIHHRLPIGAAGVLVGHTEHGHRVYVPFDTVDSVLRVDDLLLTKQITLRAAAAGARLAPDVLRWGGGIWTGMNGQTAEHIVDYQPQQITLPGEAVVLAPEWTHC